MKIPFPPSRELIWGAFALWYLTRIFMYSDGPKQLLFHIRRFLGVYTGNRSVPGTIANMLSCFFCTSLWMSLAYCLLTSVDLRLSFGYAATSTLIELIARKNRLVFDPYEEE